MKTEWRRAVGVTLLTCLLVGCEWEAGEDDGSWNGAMSWVNFSGVYRGSGKAIVGDFTYTGDSGTSSGGISVSEDGDNQQAFQTSLSGTLKLHPGVVPGSVTIVFSQLVASGSNGSARDDGSGGLTGSFNLAGPDSPLNNQMTGTIDYDTGVWTLTLANPGFLSSVSTKVSYVYKAGSGSSSSGLPGDGLTIAGGAVDTLIVEQTGNLLTIRASNGAVLSGGFNQMSGAGGDTSGLTSGSVNGSFQVSGTAGGQTVTINGSFSGNYTAPSGGGRSGTLSSRRLDGVWSQPDGTADVRGMASDVAVATPSETTTGNTGTGNTL